MEHFTDFIAMLNQRKYLGAPPFLDSLCTEIVVGQRLFLSGTLRTMSYLSQEKMRFAQGWHRLHMGCRKWTQKYSASQHTFSMQYFLML